MTTTSLLDNSYQCIIECKGISDSEKVLTSSGVFETLFCDFDFTDYVDYFALICHDRDFNESGEQKHKHIHLVCELYSPRSKKTILKLISDILGISESRISIRVAKSRIYANQYLLHQNDIEKTQYDYKDVYTNNKNKFTCYLRQEPFSDIITAKNIIAMAQHLSLIEIINEIGLQNYNKYRNTIKDIKNAVEEQQKYHNERIPF